MKRKRSTGQAWRDKRAREKRFSTLFRLVVGKGRGSVVIGSIGEGGRVSWIKNAGRRRKPS